MARIGRKNCIVQSDVIRHWVPELPDGILFPVDECVEQILRLHDPETGLIVVESAVENKRLSRAEAEFLISQQSQIKQSTLQFFEPSAQSGSETRMRLLLRKHDIDAESQVYIEDVGRVDLLARGRTIIELDGAAFHTGLERFQNDRRRDRHSTYRQFRVLRYTYADLWNPVLWPRTKREVLEYFGVRCRSKACCAGNEAL